MRLQMNARIVTSLLSGVGGDGAAGGGGGTGKMAETWGAGSASAKVMFRRRSRVCTARGATVVEAGCRAVSAAGASGGRWAGAEVGRRATGVAVVGLPNGCVGGRPATGCGCAGFAAVPL